MEFGLSEEQLLLQDTIMQFLAEEFPLEKVRKISSGKYSDAMVWEGLTKLGIPGLLIPETQGGVGLGYLEAAIISECLGYNVTPTPFLTSSVMAVTVLKAAGNQELLLSQIAIGDQRVGIAFNEALGARADAGLTVANGVINGKSIFALDGNADHYLVADATFNLYLVSTQVLKRTKLATVDRTQSTCELVYKDSEAILISNDEKIFKEAINAGRVMQAADSLGAAQSMLEQSVAYSMQREQFNRVIASFQAVKHMCADMVANLEPCRAMVWYSGHALDALPDEKQLVACHTKAHLQEVGQLVSKQSTEIHGGMGFTDLLGLHYWFKRIGANRQLLGSPEMLREEAAKIQGFIA